MKEARGRFDIAVVKGKVYAIGGSNGTTELATVEKYDPQEKKWTQITPLPLARCNIGKCIVCIYVYHSRFIYTYLQVGIFFCELVGEVKNAC
jgi:influenza virus NS1A-binding protein